MFRRLCVCVCVCVFVYRCARNVFLIFPSFPFPSSPLSLRVVGRHVPSPANTCRWRRPGGPASSVVVLSCCCCRFCFSRLLAQASVSRCLVPVLVVFCSLSPCDGCLPRYDVVVVVVLGCAPLSCFPPPPPPPLPHRSGVGCSPAFSSS